MTSVGALPRAGIPGEGYRETRLTRSGIVHIGDDATLAALIANVTDSAIFAVDPEGRVVSWNAGARLIQRYDPADIIGQPISRLYEPADAAAGHPQRLLATAAREGHVRDEGWRVRKDGTRFWAEVTISAIVGDDGQVRGYLTITRDLTERRRSDERLRQSEETLRLLVERVEDYAIFMLDPEGRIATWNAGAQRNKGYAPAEIIGRHFSIFYPPEDVAARKPERELEAAIADGRVEDEGWRVRKDGTRFWANVVITAVHDDAGRLRGFTKVTRDMTLRRRAEEAVAARGRQQAAIAGLGLAALQGRELQPLLERAVQVARDEVGADLALLLQLDADGVRLTLRASAGVDPRSLQRAGDGYDAPSELRAALASGEALAVAEAPAGARLGVPELGRRLGAVAGVLVPVHGQEPTRPFGVLAVHARTPRELSASDVGFLEAVATVLASAIARRATEEQLLAAERRAREERLRTTEAEAAVRARDEFLSVVAHELRTPLAALGLKLESVGQLARETHDPQRQALLPARLTGAAKQMQRLMVLVERLLDVSRVALGSVELHRESCDLVALTREVARDLREHAREASAALSISGASAVEGRWDPARLRQVLTNLLANAVKYGEGKPVTIDVGADDATAWVRVTDRGIGIASEDQARIFGRFERAAPLANYGGVGLGLFVSRQLAQAHGGDILLTSAPGAGSTFELRLPRA